MKNNIIQIITGSVLFIIFASCSNLNDSRSSVNDSESITVRGKVSFGDALSSEIVSKINKSKETTSRSATSSFSTDAEFTVTAYQMEEETDELTGEKVWKRAFNNTIENGIVNSEDFTWSIGLNKAGHWDIEILLWHATESGGQVYIMNGNTEFILDSMESNDNLECEAIALQPVSTLNTYGEISLEIASESSNVSTMAYEWTKLDGVSFPEGKTITDYLPSGSVSFADGKARIEASSIPAGVYEVTLSFKNVDEITLYSCHEIIPVFSGFTTDTWYGSSSYFLETEDGNGKIVLKFIITDNLFESYAESPESISVNDYPIILYDRNYSKLSYEFTEPIPGYNVFTNVSGNEKIGDGITLAQGRTVYDFAIDSDDSMAATQAIFTVENDVNGRPLRIVSYPTYGGYAHGKVLVSSIVDASENPKAYIKTICASEGFVYAFVSLVGTEPYRDKIIRISPDGKVSDLWDSVKNTEIEIDANVVRMSVNGTDLYVAYVSSGDYETGYILYCKKFTFDTGALVENGSVSENTKNLTGTAYQSYFSVSDLLIDSDGKKLYALVKYREGGETSASYGGILTISDLDGALSFVNVATLKEALEDSTTANGTSTTYVYGWNPDATRPFSEENNSFYGPQKIIAKKPDELVIADEGHYLKDGDVKNRNRVVKINLETFAMTAVDVNVGFDTYAYSENGCKYLSNY